MIMTGNGEHDDDVSCSAYCCSFLHNFYMKLERIDHKIVPDVTSESLHWQTKSHMIFVLLKLIKPIAEASMTDGDSNSNNKVNSVSCEVDQCSYKKGPEKYSARNLNLSLLSLPVESISNLLLSWGALVREHNILALLTFNVALATRFITLNVSLHTSSTSMERKFNAKAVTNKWVVMWICSCSHQCIRYQRILKTTSTMAF